MAAFEPDLDLFQAQVDSIREQTRGDWTCVVSDDCSTPERFERMAEVLAGDSRFRLSRSERRQGFYLNFERALSMAPPESALVAFADQDDRWHSEKLERLCAAIGTAQLVFSDARIVDRDGAVLSPTYWTGRGPNRTDLVSLLVSNTVTGAASVFRRELLDIALPFPRVPGQPYHDHWLALVALARGEIAYLAEPLYDYVQHPGAVLGHVGGDPKSSEPASEPRLERWRRAYLDDYRRVFGLAAALEDRCGPLPDRRKRRALRRFLAGDRSPLGLPWLALRWGRHSIGRSGTGGAERTLVAALAWRWVARFRGYAPAEAGSQR
jgi:glycosyltransferase involved in cell wall biosynthesis